MDLAIASSYRDSRSLIAVSATSQVENRYGTDFSI